MRLTSDGRKVQAIYTGNVYNVYVDEYPGSRYAKNIWCLGAGAPREYYESVEQMIADNDGRVPRDLACFSS